jgi:hypothetical protein
VVTRLPERRRRPVRTHVVEGQIESDRVCEEKGDDILIEGLVRADRAGEIPAVDRGVEYSHRQQFASGPIACRVKRDAFERALLVKARDNAVRRRDERRQGVVAKMIDGARRFDLFGRCAVQQQLEANVGADDVIDERAHIPVGTRRWSPPVVASDESQPPCELVVGHDQQPERVSRRRHMRIVAPCHSADKGAAHGRSRVRMCRVAPRTPPCGQLPTSRDRRART